MVTERNNRNILKLSRRNKPGRYGFIGSGGSRSVHKTPPVADFSDIASIKTLFMAWRKFSHGKKQRADVTEFRLRLQAHIQELHEQLVEGSYQHGTYQPFTVFDPKQRSIHKASVCDRLIHQAFVSAVEPVFERRFIYDSYSCRANKGTHAGVARLRVFLQKASKNNTRTVYALKCDIKKFFDSIDHEIMYSLLSSQISDPQVLQLAKIIIHSFARAPGKGLPLGNVTSQLFANIYLHELDFFVKHQLREKFYVRYCDDFIIIHPSKKHLLEQISRIEAFLGQHLQLQLHPHKVEIRSYHQGVDFLGSVVKPTATLIRRKTKARMLRKTNSKNLSSYLGVCSHAAGYELSQALKTKVWLEENTLL